MDAYPATRLIGWDTLRLFCCEQANEAASSSLLPRVAALELEEQRCPRAFTEGLSERLEMATAQQVREEGLGQAGCCVRSPSLDCV